MIKSADAIIIACGRMGTLHEFTTAVECRKIIGVLEGSGGTADKIRGLVKGTYRGIKRIIYDSDPASLVRKVAERVDAEKKKIKL